MYNDSEGSEDDESSGFSEGRSVLRNIKENDPDTTILDCIHITHVTDEELEELGHDIANNTHLKQAYLWEGFLNDRKASILCRGLTRSASIKDMYLLENGLSVAGVRSMVPFLQNANNLRELYLDNNNIQSEGFNELFRALRNSPIESLYCDKCGIESIDVDTEHIPKHLKSLYLNDNIVNTDGCHGLATLLQGKGATLTQLYLERNKIGDDGVGILVDALQNNKSLTTLNLKRNDEISKQGQILLLQLLNDISSIKATLQSNRTLKCLSLEILDADEDIQRHIIMATQINTKNKNTPEAAGRKKMIQTQLNSGRRAELAALQGIDHSVYSEIDPLHLPEVLSLVGQRHGQGELYVALRSSIAGVISTVNRKQCLQQQRSYYRAKIAHHNAIIAEYRTKAGEVEAEIATIEAADGHDGHVVDMGSEPRSNKRRRKWWWGLWGGT
eukprot:scaffold5971_cov111-Skeletonema_dohrnii-CCMP3373.AAC.3